MTGNFINYDEARIYSDNIADPVTRVLTSIVFTMLIQEGMSGNFSDGDFDVLFFIKVVEKAMSHHESIARALKGESLYWFDDSPNHASK